MPSVRHLKVVADAGEPDEVLALRIDVVVAAMEWRKAYLSVTSGLDPLDKAEDRLERAVRKYNAAVSRRQKAMR